MRNVLLGLAGAVLLNSGALGFDCPTGQEGPLVPVRWSAEPATVGTSVRLGVTNTFDKDIRMVDAAVWFIDGLGRPISDKGLEIDPDLTIPAAGAVISQGTYPLGAGRLVGAKFEDFTVHICTRAVLFGDGTKSQY